MFRFLILAALLLPAAIAQQGVVPATGTPRTDAELRLALFNDGRPMPVKVTGQFTYGFAEIGVARAKIQAAVADRLRSAGLWTASETESGGAYLQVFMFPIGSDEFSVSCNFHKVFSDEFGNSTAMDIWLGLSHFVATSKPHNGDAAYVEYIAVQTVDKFIAAYKRVNGL